MAMTVKEANIYVVETGGLRPIIVELMTNEGITGIGEAAVGFGIGCRAAAAMIAELTEAFVLGRDPRNISDIWNDFYYHTFWGKGGGPIVYSAASALEQAMWDIKGKALGIPVYEFLGGKQRDELRVYANGWSDTGFAEAGQLAERAAEVVADGYDAIKMYPLSKRHPTRRANLHIKNRDITGDDYRKCIESVKQVREAIGDKIDLMVDVTAAGTPDTMTRIGRELEPYNLYWYEEPLDAFDVDSYKPLKEKVNIPIAGGERLYTRYGYRRILELRALDIVQPDPGTCGGILEAYKIGAMAEAYQMRIAPHNCGSAVLTAAALQVAACSSNFAIFEIFPYRLSIFHEIVENPLELQVENGRLKIPDTPGLGVTLNHNTVSPYRVFNIK